MSYYKYKKYEAKYNKLLQQGGTIYYDITLINMLAHYLDITSLYQY